jgi:uncharacterized protein YqjF (DUF2071 family)
MQTAAETSTDQTIDRIAPTRRPPGRAIGYHHWSDLLFVHWRMPAEVVRPLLPLGLTLDTWEGDAWVGLVPFYMSRVRPWWSPPVPWLSYFCETNVRTYVHREGRDPGVWFFSLDASNSLAVRIARWRWHLPYFRSQMSLERAGERASYFSRRLWPGMAGAGCDIRAVVGAPLGHEETDRPLPAGRALPGTLEYFLIERYILYAEPTPRHLLAGCVHHHPYPIREAGLEEFNETLLSAAGVSAVAPPCHAVFCDGVAVEIFPLTECKSGFRA